MNGGVIILIGQPDSYDVSNFRSWLKKHVESVRNWYVLWYYDDDPPKHNNIVSVYRKTPVNSRLFSWDTWFWSKAHLESLRAFDILIVVPSGYVWSPFPLASTYALRQIILGRSLIWNGGPSVFQNGKIGDPELMRLWRNSWQEINQMC